MLIELKLNCLSGIVSINCDVQALKKLDFSALNYISMQADIVKEKFCSLPVYLRIDNSKVERVN